MKRMVNESFEDYKERRREEKEIIKNKLKGKIIWFSKNLHSKNKELNKGTHYKN